MKGNPLSRRAAVTLLALVAAGVVSVLAVLATRMIISGYRTDQLADATAQAERLWLLAADQTRQYGKPLVTRPAAPDDETWSIETATDEGSGRLMITATVRRGESIAAVFRGVVQVDLEKPQVLQNGTRGAP